MGDLQYNYMEAAFSTSVFFSGEGFGSYDPSTGTLTESVYISPDTS